MGTVLSGFDDRSFAERSLLHHLFFYIVDYPDDGSHAFNGVKYHGMRFLDDREPLPIGVFLGREFLEQRMSWIGKDTKGSAMHSIISTTRQRS